MLRAGTSDVPVFRQIFVQQELGFPVEGDPRVIVDAGANIGLASLYFSARFPRARILALEVEPSNFRMLETNTEGCPQVTPLLLGLWSRRTRLRINNPGAQHWAFTVSEAGEAGHGTVEGVGVGDILGEYGLSTIDLLKLDVEGAELEVFSEHAAPWVARVGTIAVEFHDRFRPGCYQAALRALRGQGYTLTKWGEYTVFRRVGLRPG
jgi:FkbM family methyltransferase